LDKSECEYSAAVAELSLAAGETAIDLAERMGAAQLAEEHGHELAPADESVGVPSGYVRFTKIWNSVRGKSLSNGLNMLQNRLTTKLPPMALLTRGLVRSQVVDRAVPHGA